MEGDEKGCDLSIRVVGDIKPTKSKHGPCHGRAIGVCVRSVEGEVFCPRSEAHVHQQGESCMRHKEDIKRFILSCEI